MGIPHQQQHQNCKVCLSLHPPAASSGNTSNGGGCGDHRREGNYKFKKIWVNHLMKSLDHSAIFLFLSLDFNNDKVVRSFHELFGPLGKKAGQPVRWEKIVIFIISLITGFSRVMLSSANNNKEKKKNKRGGVRDLNLIRKHAQQ